MVGTVLSWWRQFSGIWLEKAASAGAKSTAKASDRACPERSRRECQTHAENQMSTKITDSKTRLFKSKVDWAAWLEKNHDNSMGLWLRLAKKDSGLRSVWYKEALEVALCYGWIDGQKKPENEKTWLQRFVPRSEKSLWSKINREKALALIARGEMKAAGLGAIEKARKNGRWQAAYDSPSGATVPRDFQAALDGNARAQAFFEKLDRANRYAVLWRIQTVKKAETRARKIREFVGMLERGEKIHS
jgi:uncharacterized protein YdeI (YjbR/CyaY-like superfamily)